jgi:hypothetical protein
MAISHDSSDVTFSRLLCEKRHIAREQREKRLFCMKSGGIDFGNP